MQLIAVNKNAMINPEMISSVERRGDKLIARVGNKDFTIEQHESFFGQLESNGVVTQHQFGEQHIRI